MSFTFIDGRWNHFSRNIEQSCPHASGLRCSSLTNRRGIQPFLEIDLGLGAVEFYCPALPFQPGLYRVDVAIESNEYVLDQRQRSATLRVDPGKFMLGDFYFDHTWQIIR